MKIQYTPITSHPATHHLTSSLQALAQELDFCTQLDAATRANINAHFEQIAENVLYTLCASTPPATCASCAFCHPVEDLPDGAPTTAAFCDVPTSEGGDGIAYAIHSSSRCCHLWQHKH